VPSFDIEVPALSRGLLDRSEDVREPERVTASWPAAKVLRVGSAGSLPLVTDGTGTRLVLDDAAGWGQVPPAGAVLLGCIDGRHYWAIPADGDGASILPTALPPVSVPPVSVPPVSVPPVSSPSPSLLVESASLPSPSTPSTASPSTSLLVESTSPPSSLSLSAPTTTTGTIRSAGPLLADDEAALATTAVALLGWHAGAAFCSRCGQPTTADPTGHSRSCPSGHQEFPRTDPAVIVLVHDGAGNAVLARQPSWAPGRFSVLAGFAEAGESLEATVVREIGEEIGVQVGDVEYLGSQPWPFPRSLMIAFAARAPRGALLRPRPGEIEQARWFSRDRLRALLEGRGDGVEPVTLPDSISIARRMVEGFVRAG